MLSSGNRYTFWLSIGILFMLTGCETAVSVGQKYVQTQTPAVRAVNGGSAELMIIACPSPANAVITADVLTQLMSFLENNGVVVSGDDGVSKLTVNLCPQHGA